MKQLEAKRNYDHQLSAFTFCYSMKKEGSGVTLQRLKKK